MKKTRGFFLFITLFLINANLVFAEIEYPEGLGKEIRHYPHSKIIQTLDVTGTTMVILQITDRFSAVLDFYKKELNKREWKIITENKQKNQFTILAEKGLNSVVIDAGLNQSGVSMVNITMTPK